MEQIHFFDTDQQLSTDLAGGKGANLQKIQQIPGISTSPWFVLTTSAFKEYLKDNQIYEQIAHLERLVSDPEQNEKEIEKVSKDIRMAILHGKLRDSLSSLILNAARELEKRVQEPGLRFAVRSSGVIEDGDDSSCAGLYETVLNCKGGDQILQGVKEVWASSFNPLVIKERIRQKVKQSECLMGVVIQKQIDARAAGVVSTIVLSNFFPGIQIAANYGLGESVVGGEVGVDGWIVHPKKGYVLERVRGAKEYCYHSLQLGGIEKDKTPRNEQDRFSLDRSEVLDLAAQAGKLKAHYGCEIDIEFAIDQNGHLYILQARPLKVVQSGKTEVVDPAHAKNHKTIAQGLYSVPGVASGRLVFVPSWEDLANGKIKLQKTDIVLAYVTTNTWSQYLTNIKGLITKEGSPSSHPILLSREKKIPCVIGIEDDFENLVKLHGNLVTIDGLNQIIYKGEVPKKDAETSDLLKRFETIRIREWPDLEKSLPHLLHNKMAILHEGIYWRRTPTYPLVGFQQELNMLRFEAIPELIGTEGAGRVNAKVIDGYTCNELVPFDEYVSLLSGFSLKTAQSFNEAHEECMREFMKRSEEFKLDPDLWRQYIQTYARFRAYIWLGGAFRAFAERNVDQLGISIDLPTVYLEEASQAIQQEIPEIDVMMTKDIHTCANRFLGEKLPKDLPAFRSEHPHLYPDLEKLARQYRFELAISLDKEPDLNFVYNRILQEVETLKAGGSFETSKQVNRHRDFLPDSLEMKEWLRLSIWNRILQSDSHHIDARAKWPVRTKLLELGEFLVAKKVFKNREEIFTCSVEQIAQHMEISAKETK